MNIQIRDKPKRYVVENNCIVDDSAAQPTNALIVQGIAPFFTNDDSEIICILKVCLPFQQSELYCYQTSKVVYGMLLPLHRQDSLMDRQARPGTHTKYLAPVKIV